MASLDQTTIIKKCEKVRRAIVEYEKDCKKIFNVELPIIILKEEKVRINKYIVALNTTIKNLFDKIEKYICTWGYTNDTNTKFMKYHDNGIIDLYIDNDDGYLDYSNKYMLDVYIHFLQNSCCIATNINPSVFRTLVLMKAHSCGEYVYNHLKMKIIKIGVDSNNMETGKLLLYGDLVKNRLEDN
jgi:hypothetical protein